MFIHVFFFIYETVFASHCTLHADDDRQFVVLSFVACDSCAMSCKLWCAMTTLQLSGGCHRNPVSSATCCIQPTTLGTSGIETTTGHSDNNWAKGHSSLPFLGLCRVFAIMRQ